MHVKGEALVLVKHFCPFFPFLAFIWDHDQADQAAAADDCCSAVD